MSQSFPFDWSLLSDADRALAKSILGELRFADRRITHDGQLWFVRWDLVSTDQVHVHFHIQLAEDPPGLHTHPWDNTTVYLAGLVEEVLWKSADRPVLTDYNGDPLLVAYTHCRRPGNVVHRQAAWSHHLRPISTYAMTLFMTGPTYRKWGFWRDGSAPPNGLLPANQLQHAPSAT